MALDHRRGLRRHQPDHARSGTSKPPTRALRVYSPTKGRRRRRRPPRTTKPVAPTRERDGSAGRVRAIRVAGVSRTSARKSSSPALDQPTADCAGRIREVSLERSAPAATYQPWRGQQRLGRRPGARHLAQLVRSRAASAIGARQAAIGFDGCRWLLLHDCAPGCQRVRTHAHRFHCSRHASKCVTVNSYSVQCAHARGSEHCAALRQVPTLSESGPGAAPSARPDAC